MRLRFVTGNPGKAAEAAARLAPLGIDVVPVRAPTVEIQADELEDVARAKAASLRGRVRPPFFVEDAGLFADALNGFPGVYSAPFFHAVGCDGLLRLLDGARRRGARFRAVVAYLDGRGPPRLFAGEVRGTIARAGRGANGFGYDPVFVPHGSRRTFAEFTVEEKARRSHRGRALERLAAYLARRPR